MSASAEVNGQRTADGNGHAAQGHESTDAVALRSAGVLRRVAAMVYDLFPVLALAIVVTFPFLPFLRGRNFIPAEVGVLAYLHWIAVVLVGAGFFVFFWTRRGQTLGMRAWRLRMQKPDGSLISWKQSVTRVVLALALWLPLFAAHPFIAARWPDGTTRQVLTAATLLPLLLAYTWIWIDRDRLAWLDRWTHTRVVVLPKRRR